MTQETVDLADVFGHGPSAPGWPQPPAPARMLPVYHPDMPDRSDEHWAHVYRFFGLGAFDRAEHERGRAYYLARLNAQRCAIGQPPWGETDVSRETHRAAPPLNV